MTNSLAKFPVIRKLAEYSELDALEQAIETVIAIRHAQLVAALVYPSGGGLRYEVLSLAEHIGDQYAEGSQGLSERAVGS